MDIQEPLEELENTNNLLLKYDLDKQQFHFQQEQRGRPIMDKKGVKSSNDEITFDDKGIMIIEERKRARTTHQDAEQEQNTVKPAEQPLNFKQKNKGNYLFIQFKSIKSKSQGLHIVQTKQEVM